MDRKQEPEFSHVTIVDNRPDLDLWRSWERRRLLFNGILVGIVVVTVMIARRNLLFDARFGRFLIAEAVIANLCFCAGPVADGYLHWMGLGGTTSRRVLFTGGLIIAVPMTAVAVLLYNFHRFD